jgi:hypothetical protein
LMQRSNRNRTGPPHRWARLSDVTCRRRRGPASSLGRRWRRPNFGCAKFRRHWLYLPALHHEPHVFKHAHVRQWIAIDRDYVRKLSRHRPPGTARGRASPCSGSIRRDAKAAVAADIF